MANLLIKDGSILTMDEHNTVHNPGWVWVLGDRIGALGEGSAPDNLLARAERVIDAAHMAVLPGLTNAHTHLSQTFMRGVADDKPLLEWLKQAVWPLQAVMTPGDMRLASLLGLVENLRCGATAVVQHHKITASPDHINAVAEAAESVGLRVMVARGWVDLGAAHESPDAIVAELTRVLERWHGAAGGRITIGFGPLAPWRCSEATMRRTLKLARDWDVGTHLHVAETNDEVEMLRQRTGERHVAWLASLGALGPDVHLVHCVCVSAHELDLIAASGSVVVHCPVSNMVLASGAAPVREMLQQGIPVALGTDGPASNNSQDLLETLKVAALLAKVSTGDATALSSMDALHMVTVDGARLFAQQDVGRLVPQAKADLTLVDLNNARCMPVHRPESALVYNTGGPDVHTVIVDGHILLDAGRVTVLDEAALLAECREAARRLLVRAGIEIAGLQD